MRRHGPPVVVEVTRSGLVESRHHADVVALDADGRVAVAAGRTNEPMYPRSACKPAQAVAMLRLGLPFEGEALALATASHSGEEFHLSGVRRMLDRFGLDESALRNTPAWPHSEAAMLARVRAGDEPSALAAPCSGKHAAMLVTCVVNDWPTGDYVHPGHPLQKMITATIGELAGERIEHVAVDGCGAPAAAMTLSGLAMTFRTIATAEAGSPERHVFEAARAHPTFVSGTTRDEATLTTGVPGLFCKAGAEGVLAAALDDGRAVAVKIADGSRRGRMAVLAEMLRRLGVNGDVLDELRSAPILGGGHPVGEVRVVVPD